MNLFLLTLFFGVLAFACRQRPSAIPVAPSSKAYQKGESFLYRQNDSAFYYFNQVATSSRDSLLIAMAYNNMAVVQSDAGDYFGGQESLLISLQYLDQRKENNVYCLLSDYNELGSTSLSLKNYQAAIDYYDEALKLIKESDRRAIALNNKALSYQKMHLYDQALAIYRTIIDSARNNKKEYARILSNMARTQWLQDPAYVAAPDLLTALQIRKDEKDEWGLNASYSHLADYYSNSRPDSALLYADRMYAISKALNSPEDELEALQKLIKLSPADALRSYFSRYQYLSDSMQTSRNAAKNQFALIRYEAEKNKADNLRLQSDNTEKRIQILRQQVLIVLSIGLIVTIILWYGRRQKRIKLEARELQLSTSKKVHDVVANGLYRMMMKIEHQGTADKDALLDEIEILYEQSRNISYEQLQPLRDDFQEYITGLLGDFSSPGTKVVATGNQGEIWNGIGPRIKMGLKPILQELLVNMEKHSHAQNVVVRFERHRDQLCIQYRDDGIGLPSDFQYGNGLRNTGNRIGDLGGQITFDKETVKGLKIEIVLPIA